MAAYAHGFVVSIIGPTGQPLREAEEVGERTIRLPYESEYKIRLKNKNQVRCMAQVFVDGMDISPGRQFILAPNQTLDLERFIQDGDLDKGNKFKFVNAAKGAATGELQDPSSQQLGNIEVKFLKEYIWPRTTTFYPYYWGCFGIGGGGILGGSYMVNSNGQAGTGGAGGAGGMAGGGVGSGFAVMNNCTSHASANNMTYTSSTKGLNTETIGCNISPPEFKADAGGTAMGGESNQKFSNSNEWFYTEMPVSISIKLKGLKQPVVQPVMEPASFVILDSQGTMLGLVKSATIKLNAEKNFIEIDLVRQIAGTDREHKESSIVAEFYQDQHAYISGNKVTVVKLAGRVTDLSSLAYGKS